jgi:hypothetical protein
MQRHTNLGGEVQKTWLRCMTFGQTKFHNNLTSERPARRYFICGRRQSHRTCPVIRLHRSYDLFHDWRIQQPLQNGRNVCIQTGVSLGMPRRWRIALPTIGLCLFAALTYSSVRMNRETQRSPSRYFWWTSIRLDSDPRNRHPKDATGCKIGNENCWDLQNTWVDPGLLAKFLMLSAFRHSLSACSLSVVSEGWGLARFQPSRS